MGIVTFARRVMIPQPYPTDQPWLANSNWRNNDIVADSFKQALVWLGVVILFTLLTAPALQSLPEQLARQRYGAVIALGLIAVLEVYGLWLVTAKMRRARHWLQYRLTLDPFPGSLGGHLGGFIRLPNNADPQQVYQLELQCIYDFDSGNTDHDRRQELVWCEQGRAVAERGGDGWRLLFRFSLADDLPESSLERRGDFHQWQLRLTTDNPKQPLQLNYVVPVFKTGGQQSNIQHDISVQHQAELQQQQQAQALAVQQMAFEQTPLARAFRFSRQGQTLRFYYPMLRNPLLTLFALIFGGGFGFATYAMNHSFGDHAAVKVGIAAFSVPFAIVGFVGSIAFLYLAFNTLTVTLQGRTLTVVRRWLWIPVTKHRLDASRIKTLELKSTGSTGSGVDQIKHYKIVLHSKQGRSFTVAEDIDGEQLAEALKQFFQKQLLLGV